MRCPECDTGISEFYVNAPATIESVRRVGAEVTLENLRNELKHDACGMAYLPLFRLDAIEETLADDIDHHSLEVGDERAEFYCPACNATISAEAVWAEVERKEIEV